MSNWKLKIGAMYKYAPKEKYPVAVWFDNKVPKWDDDAVPVCVDTLNHNDSFVILEQDSKKYFFDNHNLVSFRILTKNGIVGWVTIDPAALRLKK